MQISIPTLCYLLIANRKSNQNVINRFRMTNSESQEVVVAHVCCYHFLLARLVKKKAIEKGNNKEQLGPFAINLTSN